MSALALLLWVPAGYAVLSAAGWLATVLFPDDE